MSSVYRGPVHGTAMLAMLSGTDAPSNRMPSSAYSSMAYPCGMPRHCSTGVSNSAKTLDAG